MNELNLLMPKFIWHVCTGGMTHMLRLLSGSFSYALDKNFRLFPLTIGHKAFDIKFSEVFDLSFTPLISDDQTLLDSIISGYSAQNLNLPDSLFDIQLLPFRDEFGNGHYRINHIVDIDSDEFYLPRMKCVAGEVVITAGDTFSWGEENFSLLLCAIRLNKDIAEFAVRFRESLPSNYIGVHYRNTDYQSDLNGVVRKIISVSEEFKLFNVFIATDDISSIEKFKEALPNFNIFSNLNLRFDVKKNRMVSLHYISDSEFKELGSSKLDQHKNFFTDLYCLSLSDRYIQDINSSISHFVKILRESSSIRNWFYQLRIEPPLSNLNSNSIHQLLFGDRISHRFDGILDPMEAGYVPQNAKVFVNGEQLIDVALGKKILCSSYYDNNSENFYIAPKSPYFFHTNPESNPWVVIDLGALYSIRLIRLTNRTDVCFAKASSLVFSLYSDIYAESLIDINFEGDDLFSKGECLVADIPVISDIKFRYLQIKSLKSEALHLSNIQVFSS